MKRLAVILLLAFAAMTSSCKGPRLISKSDFAKIYVDMLRADIWIKDHDQFREQADTTLLYEAVFRKYGYTTEDYIYSVGEYLENPEEYSEIVKKASGMINDRIDILAVEILDESCIDMPMDTGTQPERKPWRKKIEKAQGVQ